MDALPEVETIADRIVTLRGQRVMLDEYLARLYGVQTERLNQQVQRNLGRFPADFAFRLSSEEWKPMYLQFAGTLHRSRRSDRLPLAFTEHGCLMASNLLRSTRAVEVSVLIVRAFVRMRSAIEQLLAHIRRLTQFPETSGRQIGFTAPWPEDS
jgi:hypothetical protein